MGLGDDLMITGKKIPFIKENLKMKDALKIISSKKLGVLVVKNLNTENIMGWMSDESGLEKNEANYVPLTPLSHLRRASTVFSDRTAVIYGSHRKSYSEYYQRCSQLASALKKIGIKPGDCLLYTSPSQRD